MDPRRRWQTLQSQLTEAKARLDSGAPDEALRLVEAALNLDPEFLAARDLRESILRAIAAEFPSEAAFAAPAARQLEDRGAAAPPLPVDRTPARELWLHSGAQLADSIDLQTAPRSISLPDPLPDSPAASPTFTPAAPPAFEAKARLRRSERCLEVARQLALRGRLMEARHALAEARSLAPSSEGVARLSAELASLEQPDTGRRGWRPLAAVLAFVVALSGGWWLNRDAALHRLAMEAMEDARDLMTPDGRPIAPVAPAEASAVGATAGTAAVTALTPGAPADQAATGAATAGRAGVDERVLDMPPAGREEITVLSTTGTIGAPLTTRTIVVPAPAPAPGTRETRPVAPAATAPSTLTGLTGSSALPGPSGSPGASGLPGSPTPSAIAAPAAAPEPPVSAPTPVAAAAPALSASPGVASGDVDVPSRVPMPGPAGAPGSPAASATPTTLSPVSDDRLVRDTLQRYRAAYDALDASSARAVWPSVNSAALTRAFADLSAQQLRFDDCAVQVTGAAAQATCHGSARYVPRVGSREPREEARIWQFALRKSGTQWLIESTRVSAP